MNWGLKKDRILSGGLSGKKESEDAATESEEVELSGKESKISVKSN